MYVRRPASPPLHSVFVLAALLSLAGSVLAQEPAPVRGRVADQQGLGLPGALVELRTADGELAGAVTAAADGGFALAGIDAGTYVLTISLSGFRPWQETVQVGPGGVEIAATLTIRAFSQAVTVTAGLPEVATEQTISARGIERRVAQDLALSLREQVGVTALRRGSVNLDPAVRGLYAEQIGVFVDGTRTFAVGPARMDSGLSHVSPHALETVRIVRGPFALTWGAGTLSAIRAETFKPAFTADEEMVIGGRSGYNFGSNGSANDGFAGIWGASDRLRFAVQHNTRVGSDYADGAGNLVPGDYASYDSRWSLGGRVARQTVIEYSGGHQRQNDIDYPGRILDATLFETWSHALDVVHAPAGGRVTEIAAQAYVNAKDHLMHNDDKPTARDMPGRMPPFALDIAIPASADTAGGRAHVAVGRGAVRSKVGVDFYRLGQFAERTIARRSNGAVLFEDVIWPNARLTNTGAWGQVVVSRGRTTAGATVRVDHERSHVGEVSPFFAANTTGDLAQRNTSVSAAGSLSFAVAEGHVVNLGAGRAVRNPSTLERYSDRFPAVKFQTAAEFMGNPNLVPEKSLELSAGLVSAFGRAVVEVDVFRRLIDDYITVAPDPGLPKRLPLSPPVVFRYVQSDEARFIGADLRAQSPVTDWFTLQGSWSHVRADDTRFDEPLFGIPPVEWRAGFRLHTPDGRRWIEVFGNGQGAQERVAAARLEVPTEGWTTADIFAGVAVSEGLTLRGGIRNVADRFYVNHLNSFNPFTGMRIAETGRSFFLGTEYRF